MDALLAEAARSLATGDALAALQHVALRSDAPALALRGLALARLGDLPRARRRLREAARAFGRCHALEQARCRLAEAEVALVARELTGLTQALAGARTTLAALGDATNAAYAGYLQARWLVLAGQLDEAERTLAGLDVDALQPPSRTGYWLVLAALALRRTRAAPAHAALAQARAAAAHAGSAGLHAEVAHMAHLLAAPAARLLTPQGHRPLALAELEALLARDALVLDAGRRLLCTGPLCVALAGRPVLFALAQELAHAWPQDVAREALIARAFRRREADESLRVRLRVEIGRLRRLIAPLAALRATRRGFQLQPHQERAVVLLAPPLDEAHGEVLALLADGQAWSSSALALASGASVRSVQRALLSLAEAGRIEPLGRGRARRWMAPGAPGFPTGLLLPVAAGST